MLQLSEVDAFYGRAQVLFGVSFEVEEGEAVALLGRNGAGKTTTLKTIMGLVRATAGRITFQGRSIRGRAPHTIARRGIGYMPEDRRIFADLSVAENLKVGQQGRRRGVPAWNQKRVFQLFQDLEGLRRRRGSEISGGEQKMLALGRTLMGNPRLLLLDEPTEGLAPMIVEELADTINYLKEEGLTVVMSAQNLRFASSVADRGYMMDGGQIAAYGGMEDILGDVKLCEKYLAI